MRARTLTFALSLVASCAASCLVVVAGTSLASAQDGFDDEFGDEFGDDSGGAAGATEGGGDAAPATEGDEFGDDFSDDLGDAEGEDAEGEDAEGSADGEGAASGPRDAATLRSQRFRAHPTLAGPVGGVHIADASPGAADSFRVQLSTDFFFAGGYLNEADTNSHIGGTLALSWTVHEMLEIYASILSYANSNDMEEPQLFQVLGDTTLGVKFGYDVLPILTIGADLGITLLNTVGDIGVVFNSTSLGIRANATLDLRGLDNPVPFIARLNLQYYLDNSGSLISDVEQQRYDALPDPRVLEEEDRHLLTRVERFALNINRTDFFRLGLGLEAPLTVMEDFSIHPIVEWAVHIPVNRQGYDCLFIPGEVGSDRPAVGADGCLANTGGAAFPMSLTLGVRVLPPLKGLGILAAVDIGLTGTSYQDAVRELAQNKPYNVMLGLSYAYDTREPEPVEAEVREVERRVEVRIPPPPKGRINGLVVEQGPSTPIAGAVVRFPGTEHSPIVAGEDGHFISYEFDPGDIPMEITHDEYEPGSCVGTIAEAGGDVEVRCELVAKPRVGTVSGRVVGDGGAAVSAEVVISGAASRTVRSDAAGNFTGRDLTPGTYNARVEADGYLIKLQSFEIQPRETTNIQIDLVARPRRPLVNVRRRDIQIRRQINFATDSAEILADSYPLMTEIADVMIRNPDITRIEIQGHTDNRGTAEHNLDLSQRRADSVRQWLVDNGVEGSRLEAKGYGMSTPLVPNITPANRARNRRVQFIIQERAEAAPAE